MTYQDSFGGPQMRIAAPRMTPVVRWLLIANVAVFLLQLLLSLITPGTLAGFNRIFGLHTAWWGQFFFPLWQLGTYGFLHGGFSHIFFNMLSLYFFGTMLEGIIGSRRLAVFYAAAIVLGALLHLLAELTWGSGASAIGASGGTMAILMRPHTQVYVLLFPVQLWILASVFAFLDFFRLAQDLRYGESGNVAYMAHVGGILLGFFAVKKGWIWKDPIEARGRRQELKAGLRAHEDDVRMDELLAKISREGMNSISKREREFLKRMSKRG